MASWDGKNKSQKRASAKAPIHPAAAAKAQSAAKVNVTVPVKVPRAATDRISSRQSAKHTALLERRALVAELYCTRRLRKQQIADTLSLPRPVGVGYKVTLEMITNDLVQVRATWRDRAATHLDEMKAEELADLEYMEVQSASLASVPNSDEAAGWFSRRLQVKERKAKLLGLDAATRQEISGPNGGPIALSVELLDLIMIAANVNWDPRDERGRTLPGTGTTDNGNVKGNGKGDS